MKMKLASNKNPEGSAQQNEKGEAVVSTKNIDLAKQSATVEERATDARLQPGMSADEAVKKMNTMLDERMQKSEKQHNEKDYSKVDGEANKELNKEIEKDAVSMGVGM